MSLSKHYRTVAVTLLVLASRAPAQPALTIYNQNFAVVRESLGPNLQRGTNQVSVTDITAHMEPDSVILRDPQGAADLADPGTACWPRRRVPSVFYA